MANHTLTPSWFALALVLTELNVEFAVDRACGNPDLESGAS